MRAASLVGLVAAIALNLAMATTALADDPQWRHGAAFLGTVKYPADFKHFDYVNPQAPKGGLLRMATPGTFDNFNPVIAGLKGTIAPGTNYLYEALTVHALDETSTVYGLLAEAFRFPQDYSWASYRLRPEARWNDGKPVTPEDVVWSFQVTVKNDPRRASYYSHVKDVTVTGEREVTFYFDEVGNRELPLIVGELEIMPKHWWEGTAPDGRKRDISATTLELPLGSGPYRIKSFEQGKQVTWERVKDYWGANVPTAIGTNNFDEIRYDVFTDTTVMVEALKGDAYDLRGENSAKNWATAYEIPARTEGRLVLGEFPIRSSGGMQAFVMNLRRDKFKDVRVREALDLAFDFEELNRTTFFGQYKRNESFFAPMELGATGLPSPKELEILEPLRGKIPAEVFTTAYKSPVNGDPQKVRENLRKAAGLLKDAGYEFAAGKLIDSRTKQPFTIEYLYVDPTTERYLGPYSEALKRLGITVTPRSVDVSQYTNRMRDFDFEMTSDVFGQSISPGNEQLDFWGSKAADTRGSNNTPGIKDPAVDAIVQKIIFAKDREELIAASRALDRVLLWNHYVIPNWYYGFQRLAYWNRFGMPDKLPEYGASGFPTIWWWDAGKAAKTGGRR